MTRKERLIQTVGLVDTCWDNALDLQEGASGDLFDLYQDLIEMFEAMDDLLSNIEAREDDQ
jgi:hypothetical protein